MTGEELRNARKAVALTQQQLGELLGYEGRTAELMVQHWENGRREIPAKDYRKVAEILHVPLESLIP